MAKKKGGLFGDDNVGKAGKAAVFDVTSKVPPPEPEQPTALSPTGRKRRKDFKGTPSAKKNYHHSSVMLGVRVPDQVAKQVRERAAATGQSVNAWLQRLIQSELQKQKKRH